MMPEPPVRRISSTEHLKRQLIGIVQSHYEVRGVNPLECSLHSADDFHRALSLFPNNVTYYHNIKGTQYLAFLAQIKCGTEGGYRGVRFELPEIHETEFRLRYGSAHKLPDLK